MRRLLMLSAFVVMISSIPASAKPYRGPSPVQILTDKGMPQFVKDAADAIVLTECGMGMVRDSMLFLSVYKPGDIKHPPAEAVGIALAFLNRGSDACDFMNLGVGCSSVMREDPDISLGNQRVDDRDNTAYALFRSLQLSQKLKYRFKPVLQVIEGFPPAHSGANQTGQGVLLIRVYKPPMENGRPEKDTLAIMHDTRTERIEVVRGMPAYWIRPTVGFGGAWLEKQRVTAPTFGIVAGTHFGAYTVGAYAVEGQDFQPQNRGTAAYGIQFGDELGPSIRVGYRSTRTEIRGDGHTTERAEGVEIGIGHGFPVCRLGLGIDVLQYANLTDRGGEYRPAFTVNIDLGPLFLAK